MHRFRCLILFALLSSFGHSAMCDDEGVPEPASLFTADLMYAQSSAFWSTVHDIQDAEGNIDQINQVLNANYGTYEILFSRLDLNESEIATGWDFSPVRRLNFGFSSNLIAYGEVQNPVLPQIVADAVLSGELHGSFTGAIDPIDLHTGIGAHVGWGYEKRVNAVSTDLIQSIPTQSGHVSFYGLDFALGRNFELADGLTWIASGTASETFYSSSIDRSIASYQSWKMKNDLQYGSFTLETVLGPQPIPIDFLPRTWEYVNKLDPLPELGAMAGAGLAWKTTWGEN